MKQILRRPGFLIFLGTLIGSSSQTVLVLWFERRMSPEQFVAVAVWLSLSSISIVMVGSTTYNLSARTAFTENRLLGNLNHLHTVGSSGNAIAMVVSLAQIVLWQVIQSGSNFEHMLGTFTLVITSLIQSNFGVHRGSITRARNWKIHGVLVAADPVSRLLIVLISVLMGISISPVLFYFSAMVSAVITLLAARLFTHEKFSLSLRIDKDICKSMGLFWIISIGLHLVVSFLPALASLSGVATEDTKLLALGLLVTRIPLTLASTTLPVLLISSSGSSSSKIDSISFKSASMLVLFWLTFGAVGLALLQIGPIIGLLATVVGVSTNQGHTVLTMAYFVGCLLSASVTIQTLLVAWKYEKPASVLWVVSWLPLLAHLTIFSPKVDAIIQDLLICSVISLALSYFLAIKKLDRTHL